MTEYFNIFLVGLAWVLLTRRHSLELLPRTLLHLWSSGLLLNILAWGAVRLELEPLYVLAVAVAALAWLLHLSGFGVVFLYTLALGICFSPFGGGTAVTFWWQMGALTLGVLLMVSLEERYRYQVVPRSLLGFPFRVLMLGGIWLLLGILMKN